MAMSSGGAGRGMSEINVTPLVDVMLVLMIIFMITAPMIQQGVKVDLPTASAPAMPSNNEIMVITLTRERRILIGETELPFEQLEEKLVGNIKLQKQKEIFLHADRSLPYGFIVDVMAILKEAGVQNLGMVTDPFSDSAK